MSVCVCVNVYYVFSYTCTMSCAGGQRTTCKLMLLLFFHLGGPGD